MGGAVHSATPPSPKTSVSFVLNGRRVVVEGASPLASLNEWIRDQPGLSGTKRMCGEGGCGCCTVAASFLDPVTKRSKTIAINSVSGRRVHVISIDYSLDNLDGTIATVYLCVESGAT